MEHLAEIFIFLMIAVAFLQSGIDKITDWKGNFEFHSKHFEKSPFKDLVKINLGVIALLEMITGVLALVSVFMLFTSGELMIPKITAVLAALTLGALFTGQRLAKDYAGAQTIVVYLIPVFFLVWLLFG